MSNKLSLKLTKIVSPLDGMTCYEPIDVMLLDKLINSSLLLKQNNESNGYERSTIYANEKIQLIKYRELIENGKAKVIYKKSENNPFGRCNPVHALGMFSLRKLVRYILAQNFFVDIDIKCCHPTILLQLCEQNNIKCSYLKKYVEEYDMILEEVCKTYKISRDAAKQLFIRLLNCGTIDSWFEDNNITDRYYLPILLQFKNEILNIADVIDENNPEIKSYVTSKNIKGSVCSFFLQEIECRILNEVYQYCVQNEFIQNNVCVLSADGIMLELRLFKEELLVKFSDLIYEKYGLHLKFVVKPMNAGLTEEDINKSIEYDLYSPTFTTGLLSDYFKLLYGNKFIFSSNQLYYFTGVYWKMDDKKCSLLTNFIDKEFYLHLVRYTTNLINIYSEKSINEDVKDKDNYTHKVDKLNVLLSNIQLIRKFKFLEQLIQHICIKITDNNIIFNSSASLFAFNNKIYDLKTHKFKIPSSGDYISLTTGYDYVDGYNTISKKKILHELLDTIFPKKEIKDLYLTILSTGMFGQNLEKFVVATGAGGNGKGLINEIAQSVFGNYAYVLPSNVLLNPLKTGANPEVANLNNKRCVFVREPDNNYTICCATMKELTGGNEVNARLNYSNDTCIKLTLTLVMECNDMPKLNEVKDGVSRRLIVIPFESSFIDKDQYDKLPINQRTNVFVKNMYYKSTEFKNTYRQAFFDILTEYFMLYEKNNYDLILPEIIRKKNINYLENSDDIYEWTTDNFEQCEESSIKMKEIYRTFTSGTFYNNLNKNLKRQYNYKYFVNKLETNFFLKSFICFDSDKIMVLKNFKNKINQNAFIDEL